MTNIEILRVFLKSHRKYSSFKRQQYLDELKIVAVREAINYNFYWNETEEDLPYWDSLNDKWWSLCDDFNLTETIDLRNI